MDSLSGFPLGWLRSMTLGKATWIPTETLVVCPYDRSHHVMKRKFSDHLKRCRTNYEIKKEEMEQGPPLMVSCRYDVSHQFYAPELEYHEYGCTKREKCSNLERVYAKNPALLEAICKMDDEKEGQRDGKRRAKQLAVLMEEAKNEEPVKDGNLAELATGLIEMVRKRLEKPHVLWADPAVAQEFGVPLVRGIRARSQLTPISQVMDMEAFGADRRVVWVHNRYRYPLQAIVEEEDDDWERDNPVVGSFDWMEHQKYVKGVSSRMPAGLTRAQKKAFLKENGLRLKYEEGWFAEDFQYGDDDADKKSE